MAITIVDESAEGGILLSRHSPMGKELLRWDTPKRNGGERADGFEEYPKMLYRARELANGVVTVFDQIGELSPDINKAEQARTFNTGNVLKVQNDLEERNALSRGWRPTTEAAIAVIHDQQRALSNAAAEAQYTARRMSDTARREFEAADQATHEHIADVPAPKKRGRKPKVPVV